MADQIGDLVAAADTASTARQWTFIRLFDLQDSGRPHPDGAVAFVRGYQRRESLTAVFRSQLGLAHQC